MKDEIKEIEEVEEEEQLTPHERKIERLKALYQARMIILRAGTVGEKIACNKAMKKMQKKYKLHDPTKDFENFQKLKKISGISK